MSLNRESFLTNRFSREKLVERTAKAQSTLVEPLWMHCQTAQGAYDRIAFNEVVLTRETSRIAKIEVVVNGAIRLNHLEGDGVLVCTPVGSTAYNLAAHGPILPLGCRILGITPIAPFRPRRWPGAILPQAAEIQFRITDALTNPVRVTADFTEILQVRTVTVRCLPDFRAVLLFDRASGLAERQISEQFDP